jgi:hypothetical protein
LVEAVGIEPGRLPVRQVRGVDLTSRSFVSLQSATQYHEAGYWRRELLARELLEEGVLNLRLRHLKFLRELTRHVIAELKTQAGTAATQSLGSVLGICRTHPRAVVENRDYYHAPDGKPLLEIDIYFAPTDDRYCDVVREIAEGLAARRPLSKYSIAASIHVQPVGELDLHTLAVGPDETLYVYEGLRVHRYATNVAASRWKTLLRKKTRSGSAPLLIANSPVLLPARNTPSLLDMSAIVAKRGVLAYALKRHCGDIEKVAAALGVSLYSLVKEMRALNTPLPPGMPVHQRALIKAAKAINPSIWQLNEDEAAYTTREPGDDAP